MNPFDAAIDLDEIGQRNSATVVDLVTLMCRNLLDPMPSETQGQAFMKKVIEGLGDTARLITEVKRLRDQRQKIRDLHTPANSGDPAAPGAVCTGCSLHGARVAWPCPTWNATEDPAPAPPMPGFGMPGPFWSDR